MLKIANNSRVQILVAGIVGAIALGGTHLPCASAQSPTGATDSVVASLAEARILLNSGDYTRADQILRETLIHAPDSPDAHFLLGFALLYEQQPKQSLAEYTSGARFRDPTPNDLIAVASDYILLQDYTDADRWLTMATQRSPSLVLAWYLLGRTQYKEDHAADAERSFQACLRIDPHHVRAEYNLGLVYEKLQRPDEAIAAYKTAIAWQENAAVKDPQPYLDLGILLRYQGHVAEALPYLITAAAEGSRNPMTHQELGLAYEQLGRYDDAVNTLKQAIALSPNVESLHFFLGRIYRRTGRAAEAANEFAEAAQFSGTKSNAGVLNLEVRP